MHRRYFKHLVLKLVFTLSKISLINFFAVIRNMLYIPGVSRTPFHTRPTQSPWLVQFLSNASKYILQSFSLWSSMHIVILRFLFTWHISVVQNTDMGAKAFDTYILHLRCSKDYAKSSYFLTVTKKKCVGNWSHPSVKLVSCSYTLNRNNWQNTHRRSKLMESWWE